MFVILPSAGDLYEGRKVGMIEYFAEAVFDDDKHLLAHVRMYDHLAPCTYGSSEIPLIATDKYKTMYIEASHIGPMLATGQHPRLGLRDMSPREHNTVAVLPTSTG